MTNKNQFFCLFYGLVKQDLQFAEIRSKKKLVLTKTMRAKIKPKLQRNYVDVPQLVHVTILLYAIHNEIPHVVTIMQSIVSFGTERIFTSSPIAYDVVDEFKEDEDLRNQIPFKFHVIITPVVPGDLKANRGIAVQHVFNIPEH